MTREEAIDIIRQYECCKEHYEACEMAIQALSQEPQCTEQPCLGTLCRYYKEPCRVKNELNIELNELKPCDDVVSRQAVIYYIKGHIHEIITESGTDKNAHTNSILRALINGVETMPSVTPSCDKCAMNGSGSKYCDNCKQKSGKWICIDDYHIGKFKCSVCQTEGFPNTVMYKPTWNYRPNCGCRMVEPQESEEQTE